jgi:hypothetical protein
LHCETIGLSEQHHTLRSPTSIKEAPHRPIEHDKWKIVPKHLYDKADFE